MSLMSSKQITTTVKLGEPCPYKFKFQLHVGSFDKKFEFQMNYEVSYEPSRLNFGNLTSKKMEIITFSGSDS